ncbi:unnamed protein product, partial [Staurois parvus]
MTATAPITAAFFHVISCESTADNWQFSEDGSAPIIRALMISAEKCHPPVPPICAQQCHPQVPLSATHMCPAVPPTCVHQCLVVPPTCGPAVPPTSYQQCPPSVLDSSATHQCPAV